MTDAKIAAVGRRLAEALRDAAYTRKPEDKKLVAEIQHELVVAVEAEKPSYVAQQYCGGDLVHDTSLLRGVGFEE